MAGFKLIWEQQEPVTIDFESEAVTPVELLEVLGPRGRAMLLEVLCINYEDETLQMLKATTWTGAQQLPAVPPSPETGEPVKPPRRS